MQNWFQCSFKARHIDDAGHDKKITRNILIDAVSYTEAEAKVASLASQYSGEISSVSIKQSNVTEIISKEGEWWYKAKINLISIDEEAGKEKKIANYILVSADNIDEALKNLTDGLSYMLVPYSTFSISLTPIMDVYPYEE
jgi:hypothetical protein